MYVALNLYVCLLACLLSTFIFTMFTKTFELSVLKEEELNIWHAYSAIITLSDDTYASNLMILSMTIILKLVF